MTNGKLNRRRFLQATATSAACGLATHCAATALDSGQLVDTHVYVGHWPLRQLDDSEPAQLVAALRRVGVTQAWAGSFDGLFHKDVDGVNTRLVGTCRVVGDGLLVPVGTINPTLPDWEEDVRRCHEVFKMPGIRLHPTYHGYGLDDPRFAKLVALATERKLFVQLVAQLADERRSLLTPRVLHVDLSPLAQVVRSRRGLRLVVCNGIRAVQAATTAGLAPFSNVNFDISRVSNGEALRALASAISPKRLVYGSAAPLFEAGRSIELLNEAELTADQLRTIRAGNAQRLMSSSHKLR
jgi:uncharacterized protein